MGFGQSGLGPKAFSYSPIWQRLLLPSLGVADMIVRVHNPLVHLYEGFYSAFGGIVMRSKSMQAGGAPCWNKSFGLFPGSRRFLPELFVMGGVPNYRVLCSERFPAILDLESSKCLALSKALANQQVLTLLLGGVLPSCNTSQCRTDTARQS